MYYLLRCISLSSHNIAPVCFKLLTFKLVQLLGGRPEIQQFCFGTDGRGANNLIVKTGGSRSKLPMNDLIFDEYGNPKSSDHLYMDGREILNYTLDYFPPLVADTLSKNNLTQENIDLFVFHQANKFIMELLRKKMKIDNTKFYRFYENIGNTVSSTIPIALKEALSKEVLIKNNSSKILLAAPGLGYSWAGVVIKHSSTR